MRVSDPAVESLQVPLGVVNHKALLLCLFLNLELLEQGGPTGSATALVLKVEK